MPARQTVTDEFETTPHDGWTGRQQQHLSSWLAEYDRPGFYSRAHPGQNPRHFYTHFKCASGLLWLAEALGEDPDQLHRACDAITAAGANPARQCGALRAVIPWERIEELFRSYKQPRKAVLTRLRRSRPNG